MTPKVSILILTHERIELSTKCIPQIIGSIGDIPHEVLVWDNASTDGTYDWLYEYSIFNNIKIFGSDKNIGLEAINYLAKEATGEYIIKVDDDVQVPHDFAQRLVKVYEKCQEPKIAYLGWDMPWTGKTFATRSGMALYKKPHGKIISFSSSENVLVSFNPTRWMVNGVCRLSKRDLFLELGGHPVGQIYGVDTAVSRQAAKMGYWVAYYKTIDMVKHLGGADSSRYRKFKDFELHKHKAPKAV